MTNNTGSRNSMRAPIATADDEMVTVEDPLQDDFEISEKNDRKKCEISICWGKVKCSPSCMKEFLIANFLPIGLFVLVVLGITWPTPGLFINHPAVQYAAVIGIFIITGLFLKTDGVKKALTAYMPLLWGVISILFVTPVIGVSLVDVLPYEKTTFTVINGSKVEQTEKGIFGSEDFKRGMQLFFSGPCTVTTGVVMVTQTGGNSTLALLLTVLCNILGTFTVPLILKWLMKLKGDVSIKVGPLLLKLTLTIILPTIIGKALKFLKPVDRFCKSFRTPLKLLSITFLLILPWMKISESRQSGDLDKLALVPFLLIVCGATLLHAIYLIINYLVSFLLRFDMMYKKCIVILGSQKTLAIALSIVNFLPPEAGAKGLLVIPMLVSHFAITMIDSIIVVTWRKISPPPVDVNT